ncbi:MAG: V-type ATP synthase subunit I, partial [Pseudomonadota bacterium]
MSIAQLRKLTLVGPKADEHAAMEALQALGCMHVLPLAPQPGQPEDSKDRAATSAYQALRFLADVADPRRQVQRDADFDIHSFVPQVLDLRDRIRATEDRRDFLAHRIDEVRPWGDLIFPPKDDLAGLHLWFYKLPHKDRAALDAVEIPWQIVHADNKFHYVVLIARDEPDPQSLPIARSHTGAEPVSELEAQLEESEILLEALAAERLGQTRYLTLMRAQMSLAESRAELDFARQQVLHDEGLFAVQGWVPEDRAPAVEADVKRIGLALLSEPPEKGETPPTLLDQPQAREAGVDLALFYQVPGYRDWDPTLVVSFSFAVFFAMIVADAGYGLVIALIVAMLWSRLGETAHNRSWRLLLAMIAGATMIFGVLIGGYFGAALPESSPLMRLKIMDINDFSTMMTLSVAIGVVHLVLANLINARVHWGRTTAYASLGWIAVLLGGLGYWLTGSSGLVTPYSGLMAAGLAAVFVFSSDQPLHRPKDWLIRIAGGLQGLTGVMGIFGDVLSYMRIFALGLASASLALTFNQLAGEVRSAVPGMGLLLALLILLIGHALNFGLALMSGVVHGLRLNYIEFFKWGLTEE